MVGVGIWKIALLLLSLSLLSDRGDSALSEKKLESIMDVMFTGLKSNVLKDKIFKNEGKNDKTGIEYSFALQLKRDDCEKGQLKSISIDFDKLMTTIASRNVYDTDYIVAAIPGPIYKDNTKIGMDHAEHRVLEKLRQKTTKHECLIIYTYASPCYTKCLNGEHKYNILDVLENLKKKDNEREIVLIFSSLYRYFDERITKQSIYDDLKKVPVPIYCCYKKGGRVTCAMFDKNKDKNQLCLSEKIESN